MKRLRALPAYWALHRLVYRATYTLGMGLGWANGESAWLNLIQVMALLALCTSALPSTLSPCCPAFWPPFHYFTTVYVYGVLCTVQVQCCTSYILQASLPDLDSGNSQSARRPGSPRNSFSAPNRRTARSSPPASPNRPRLWYAVQKVRSHMIVRQH